MFDHFSKSLKPHYATLFYPQQKEQLLEVISPFDALSASQAGAFSRKTQRFFLAVNRWINLLLLA